MAALTAERNTPKMAESPIIELPFLPLSASVKVFKGGIAVLDGAGFVRPGAAGHNFYTVGRFEETVDNSSGSAGAKSVHVRQGIFKWASGATVDVITQADVGFDAYVIDDQTVGRTSASGTRSKAGKVLQVDSDGVWIESGVVPADKGGVDIELIAAADLTLKANLFVTVDAAGKAALAGLGVMGVGILLNAPNTGEVARIRTLGIGRVIAGGAVTKGDPIAIDAAGKAKTAVKSATNTSDAGAAQDPLIASSVMGVALETGVLDALMSVVLLHQGAIATTAA